jgi:hypothetical protein
MNLVKKFAGTAVALMLIAAPTFSATAAWGQTMQRNAGSMVNTTESASDMDMSLAHRISQAWAENKDASGAVAFQENGEIALSDGNEQLARHYFEAAEENLAQLKPLSVPAPVTAEY